jgi:hypothetical protein
VLAVSLLGTVTSPVGASGGHRTLCLPSFLNGNFVLTWSFICLVPQNRARSWAVHRAGYSQDEGEAREAPEHNGSWLLPGLPLFLQPLLTFCPGCLAKSQAWWGKLSI